MSTKLSQEQKTIQRQIATQQTIRLMQLVELPYASLEQEILKEVDENPALEAYHEDDDERMESSEVSSSEYDENGDPLDLSQSRLSDEDIFKEEYYRDADLDDYHSAIDGLMEVYENGNLPKRIALENKLKDLQGKTIVLIVPDHADKEHIGQHWRDFIRKSALSIELSVSTVSEYLGNILPPGIQRNYCTRCLFFHDCYFR